jgi:soluble P-type ATPase
MLTLCIPGYSEFHIEHLVLDYNGTLAIDGAPCSGALAILSELSDCLNIHVVTADSHGTVRAHLRGEHVSLYVIRNKDQCQQKMDFVAKLGPLATVAIGNGYNDHLMLKEAAIGIAVAQQEGLASQTLAHADLVFGDIVDALDCLRNPMRLVASLRR